MLDDLLSEPVVSVLIQQVLAISFGMPALSKQNQDHREKSRLSSIEKEGGRGLVTMLNFCVYLKKVWKSCIFHSLQNYL